MISNLLVLSGTKIKSDRKGNYYTTGSFDERVWGRYKNLANNIILLAPADSKHTNVEGVENRYNIIPHYVQYVSLPDRSSIRSYISIRSYKDQRRIVKEQIDKADAALFRVPFLLVLYAAKVASKKKMKYLIEVIGCPWDALWNHGSLVGKVFAPFGYLSMRHVIKNAPYVLYVTKQFLQKRYPTKGKSIGVSDVCINDDFNYITNAKDQADSSNVHETFTVGTAAGVDVRYKGQQYVIKALALLKRRGIIVKYSLAGSGKGDYLMKLASTYGVQDQIEILGSIPYTQMGAYYKSLSLYVQMSLQDGIPRSVIEAMSYGKAVVGARTGGLPELIRPNCIVQRKNYRTLAKKIEEFIMNPHLLAIEGQKNKEMASFFTMQSLNRLRDRFLYEALL